MDIQRLQPGLSEARPITSARLPRIAPPGNAPAATGRGLPKISGPQVTSDAQLQSVLSAEETQALAQLFAAFRSAAETIQPGTYTDRGRVPRLPPLGGGRPGQLIDVVA